MKKGQLLAVVGRRDIGDMKSNRVDALCKLAIDERVRPLTMTALTAILGLLPAALSTKIGAQTQRPLAIVIVGGMIMIMLLLNLVGVFYSFYGRREPPASAGVQH